VGAGGHGGFPTADTEGEGAVKRGWQRVGLLMLRYIAATLTVGAPSRAAMMPIAPGGCWHAAVPMRKGARVDRRVPPAGGPRRFHL